MERCLGLGAPRRRATARRRSARSRDRRRRSSRACARSRARDEPSRRRVRSRRSPRASRDRGRDPSPRPRRAPHGPSRRAARGRGPNCSTTLAIASSFVRPSRNPGGRRRPRRHTRQRSRRCGRVRRAPTSICDLPPRGGRPSRRAARAPKARFRRHAPADRTPPPTDSPSRSRSRSRSHRRYSCARPAPRSRRPASRVTEPAPGRLG